MLNITKLPNIYCKLQLNRQLQASSINFGIIILNIYYKNLEIIQKGVPQTAAPS